MGLVVTMGLVGPVGLVSLVGLVGPVCLVGLLSVYSRCATHKQYICVYLFVISDRSSYRDSVLVEIRCTQLF